MVIGVAGLKAMILNCQSGILPSPITEEVELKTRTDAGVSFHLAAPQAASCSSELNRTIICAPVFLSASMALY